MSRFNYIRYDEFAAKNSEQLKELFQQLEKAVDFALPDGRAKSLALTAMEECFMWCGKGLRDEQLARERVGEAGRELSKHLPERG